MRVTFRVAMDPYRVGDEVDMTAGTALALIREGVVLACPTEAAAAAVAGAQPRVAPAVDAPPDEPQELQQRAVNGAPVDRMIRRGETTTKARPIIGRH